MSSSKTARHPPQVGSPASSHTFIRVPRCGITGPSTNRCWNEQAVVPSSPDPTAIRSARAASRAPLRSLTPQPSPPPQPRRLLLRRSSRSHQGHRRRRRKLSQRQLLGDGLQHPRPPRTAFSASGPARLRRAGTLHPPDPSPIPQQSSPQASLSGQVLRRPAARQKSDYREHCRGDACPNFAPPDLIQIRLDLDPACSPRNPSPPRTLSTPRQPDPPDPLVSCIMPTYNRRAFLPRRLLVSPRRTTPTSNSSSSTTALIPSPISSPPIRDSLLPSQQQAQHRRQT